MREAGGVLFVMALMFTAVTVIVLVVPKLILEIGNLAH